MHDVKQALRQLLLRPGLAVAVIAMLAVGIGATTAIFSLFHQVLLQSLPVPEPDRLVELRVSGVRQGAGRPGLAVNDFNATFSYRMFRELEAEQAAFSGIAGHYDFMANLTSGTETMAGSGAVVSGGYFQVLNLTPALGRFIGPEDEPQIGESNVVVLSHDYWQNGLGGNPNVLGETLIVNDQPLTIIGVAPEGFYGAMKNWQPHVFVPMTLRWLMQPEEPRNDEIRYSYWVYAFARLMPGATIEQATERINRLYSGIVAERDAPAVAEYASEAEMQQFLAHRLALEPVGRGQGADRATASNPLSLLLGATVLVLLIVCVNITSLLLARGAARAGELAIRASIGASRGRLAAQLLGESAALAVIGGLLALPVAAMTLRIISAMVPSGFARQFTPTLDAQAFAFATITAVAAVLLFGLLPALKASDTDPGRIIKGQAGQPSGGRGLARFRRALIGTQIALSTVLLVLAGLFTQSLANIWRVNFGMDLESTISFSVLPRASGYDGERLDALYARITEALEAQPGVLSVGQSALPLLGGARFGGQVAAVAGRPIEGNAGGLESNPWISPRFFETMSIPVLAGREFTEADRAPGTGAVIVNQAFLRRFDLGMDAVGQRMEINASYYPESSVEIIGIVGDARFSQVKGGLPPQMFTPRPRNDGSFSSLFFYVKGAADADTLTGMIQPAVAGVDPNLPVGNLMTMVERVRNQVYQDRLIASLSAVFAGLATLLAAVGLYAVLNYNIGERTRELGLRLALGASPAGLLAMVLRQVGSIAAVAIAVGLVAALGVGRLAEALLFDLSAYDPVAFGLALATITAVALGASYLPARRASKVAPMQALREQ
jgi:predicted permease